MKIFHIIDYKKDVIINDEEYRDLVYTVPYSQHDQWMHQNFKLQMFTSSGQSKYIVEDEKLLALFLLNYSHYFTYNIYEE